MKPKVHDIDQRLEKPESNAALRREAFQLRDEGWEPDDVAELLELNKWTIAGWLSWRTKGHYDSKDKP